MTAGAGVRNPSARAMGSTYRPVWLTLSVSAMWYRMNT